MTGSDRLHLFLHSITLVFIHNLHFVDLRRTDLEQLEHDLVSFAPFHSEIFPAYLVSIFIVNHANNTVGDIKTVIVFLVPLILNKFEQHSARKGGC